MPKYTPILMCSPIRASQSDLIELGLKGAALKADFIIPGDETQVLRVQFDRAEMLRVLDEMPLSTEDEATPNEGLLPDHFAYIVEGAAFWKSQSAAFKTVHNQAKHYRLITGWTCLDIISNSEPTFAVVLVA